MNDHRRGVTRPRTFLSFLGTGAYRPARYRFEAPGAPIAEPPVDVFVQAAILRHLRKVEGWDFGEGVVAKVLVTEKAREKNWRGLQEAATVVLPPGATLEPVPIPEGNSEEELWGLFQAMVDAVPPEAELVLDITHSFRSLPFMAGSVVHYLQETRDVNCTAIYYGAYREENAPAPVIDLRAFLELERWTGAIGEFRRHGEFTRLYDLSRQANRALKKMDPLLKSVRYCRGRQLHTDGGRLATEAREALDGLRHRAVAPMHPLLDEFTDILGGFREDDPVASALHAARLCLQFGLVQQGLTILEETITTWVLLRAGVSGKRLFDFNDRRVVWAVYILVRNALDPDDPGRWPAVLNKIPPRKVQELHRHGLVTDRLVKVIDNVKQARNDINHFGLTDPMTVEKLREALARNLDAFGEIVAAAGR